jgi:alkanesulfonate monooxygenase SsuD/methylene tetrahydromethanopterin reductase-like flavin-dependent oxidoreductase (luciferase family)
MSLGLNAVYVASHWDAVEEGARNTGRKPPSRSEWRIVRDIWVADTDEEARDGALNGMLGRAWREYLHPLFSFGAYPFLRFMKHDESIPDEDVTLEYMADHLWLVGSPNTVANKLRDLYEMVGGFGTILWLVGSPNTVANKLRDLYEMVGGFGTILWLTFDHSENRPAYEKSMRLLAEEVMPQVADLTGD